jgi:hypothetical protein
LETAVCRIAATAPRVLTSLQRSARRGHCAPYESSTAAQYVLPTLQAHAHAHERTHTHKRTRAHTHAHTRTHASRHTHTHTRTHTHAHIHTHARACTHTRTGIYTHTPTRTHTRTHTHRRKRTYAHTRRDTHLHNAQAHLRAQRPSDAQTPARAHAHTRAQACLRVLQRDCEGPKLARLKDAVAVQVPVRREPLVHPRGAVRARCTDTCASRARARGEARPRAACRSTPSKSPSIVVCGRPGGQPLRGWLPCGLRAHRRGPHAGAKQARGGARTGAEVAFVGVPLRARRKRELPVPEDDRTPQRTLRARGAERLRHATAHAKQKPVVRTARAAIRGSGSAPACHRRARHRTRLQQTARHVSARPMLCHCDFHAGPAAGALRCMAGVARSSLVQTGLRARGTHGGRAGGLGRA